MDANEEAYQQHIRAKRTQTLLGVWNTLVANGQLSATKFKLSAPLVNEVIEQYVADLGILKKRYRIEQRIQLHKIAGLMTAAILRFRPVIPLVEEYTSEYDMCANELLAIFHGVAICGEYTTKDGCLDVIAEDWFNRWLRDFLYLLHYRNHTPESLMFIYETLCCVRFRANLEKSED